MREPDKCPQRIESTRVWRFYRGGQLIDDLRGDSLGDGEFPEDWLGSVTPARNPGRGDLNEGLSRVRLSNGSTALLAEMVQGHRSHYLGSSAGGFPSGSTGLLVKLLDPTERLPVHAHPNRSFARSELGSPFGKAEAWLVLRTREEEKDPHVYVGLREQVSRSAYTKWIVGQDTEALLGSLHKISVRVGDVVYVPPGVPHAIGPNVLIAEVQEPTDFSFLCEHEGYPIQEVDAYMGLPLEVATRSLDLTAWSASDVDSLMRISPDGDVLLHGPCQEFFSATRREAVEVPGGAFAIGLCVTGEGSLTWPGGALECRPGSAFVIPAGLRSWGVEGSTQILEFTGSLP